MYITNMVHGYDKDMIMNVDNELCTNDLFVIEIDVHGVI